MVEALGDWGGMLIRSSIGETTPYSAADGRSMCCSSDRPGGLGSQDIYMTKRLNDTWGSWRKPVNVGCSRLTRKRCRCSLLVCPAEGDRACFLSSGDSLGEKDTWRLALGHRGGS
jgi:hypothetical protein